ncbi:hypothetical protein CMK12_16780 [Candidatus Poribacteria bacterium]|nr:hypothetical protein [Candidatus Poribacteria bacterium]
MKNLSLKAKFKAAWKRKTFFVMTALMLMAMSVPAVSLFNTGGAGNVVLGMAFMAVVAAMSLSMVRDFNHPPKHLLKVVFD